MPVRMIINAKHVVKNNTTTKIMNIYEDALKKASISSASALAASGPEVKRQGIWVNYVLVPFEIFSGAPVGAKSIILPELALELDPPAEALFIGYRSFLNKLLTEQEISAKQTETEEIESPFVLTWELLLRLTAIALCDRLDYQNDGDNLKIAIESFVENIFRKSILVDSHFLKKNTVSAFWKSFAIDYQKWHILISHMITCVKTLRGNQDAVSSTLTALSKAKNVLKSHLLAFLCDTAVEGMLSDTWISDTWHGYVEKTILSNKIFPDEEAEAEAILAAINTLSVINGKKLEPYPNKEHIKNLYILLRKTELFYKIMSQIDLWMTSAGWIPILSGAIDFVCLSKTLSEHGNECTSILKASHDLGIVQKPLGLDYLRFQAIASDNLQQLMMDSGIKLFNLVDEMTLKSMSHMLYNIGFSLFELQKNLDLQDKFLRIDPHNKNQLRGKEAMFPLLSHSIQIGTLHEIDQKDKKIKPEQPAIVQSPQGNWSPTFLASNVQGESRSSGEEERQSPSSSSKDKYSDSESSTELPLPRN